MTAIKPIENRRVLGVSSSRYPLNTITAHPTNDEPAEEAHHCFPRSQITNACWFVEITFDSKKEAVEFAEQTGGACDVTKCSVIIPHVTGLTKEEHRKVEAHEAKILLEDGVWVWYDRTGIDGIDYENVLDGTAEKYQWTKVGALNPQPGSREGKAKKKRRKAADGDKLRNRGTWQVRVPKDEIENGANILDEYVEVARELLMELEAPGVDAQSPTYQIVVPLIHAGMVSLDAENKARKKAAKEERARKKAERAAS